jgi:hypothetical protein
VSCVCGSFAGCQSLIDPVISPLSR